MIVEIEKRADGSSLLRCTRPDGSVTWQETQSRHGAYFPLHDLIHFAVETVLRTRSGFFGLIAQGWAIEDTTGKGARGPIPTEARNVELIVGLLQSESASGQEWSSAQFMEQAALFAASRNEDVTMEVTDEQLQAIRARMRDLHSRWGAIRVGGVLPLDFPLGS